MLLQKNNFLCYLAVTNAAFILLSDFSDVSKTYFSSNDPENEAKLDELFNLFCENENEGK